jgi:hypothetical protein
MSASRTSMIPKESPTDKVLTYSTENEGYTILNDKGVRVMAGLKLDGLKYEQVAKNTIVANGTSNFLATKWVGYNSYVIFEIIHSQTGHISDTVRVTERSPMYPFIYPTEAVVN